MTGRVEFRDGIANGAHTELGVTLVHDDLLTVSKYVECAFGLIEGRSHRALLKEVRGGYFGDNSHHRPEQEYGQN